MGYITGQINLHAEAQKVWKFITNPTNFPEYIYGYVGGKATTPNEVGLGAQYEWYGRIGPLKLKSTEEIIEWREEERVAYRGKMLGVKFNSSMTVQKAEGDGTMLVVTIEYEVPTILGGAITDTVLLKRIVREYVDQSLKRLGEIFGK